MRQTGEVITPGAGEATSLTVAAALFDRESWMKGCIDEQGPAVSYTHLTLPTTPYV